MLASLGVSGVVAGSACDRECPDFCYDGAGADAPSEATSDVSMDAAADTTPDGAADAPNAADAAVEAAEICPTGYQVITGVLLADAGVTNGNPQGAVPIAIIVGADRAFWFIAAAVRSDRQVGHLSIDDAGAASLGFIEAGAAASSSGATGAGAPTGIAVGHDNAEWFDLSGALGRADGAGDSVHVIPVGQGTSTSMTGLSVDRDGLLWWIASQQGPTLAWTAEQDASVVTSVGTTVPVTSLASNIDGFTWFTYNPAFSTAGRVAEFGRALADGAEPAVPVPVAEGGSLLAQPGPLAPSGDGTMWLLMDPTSQNGWIVAARALDAAAAIPFPVDSGLHAGLAAVGPSCGMLVTHSSPGGLTLVSLDGAIAELPNRGTNPLANSVGPVAVDDRMAAVVGANPPSIVILRLLP